MGGATTTEALTRGPVEPHDGSAPPQGCRYGRPAPPDARQAACTTRLPVLAPVLAVMGGYEALIRSCHGFRGWNRSTVAIFSTI